MVVTFLPAAADSGALQVHGAGAAQPHAATELGAGELEVFAHGPQQGHVGVGIDASRLAVDGELDHGSPRGLLFKVLRSGRG